MNVRSMLPFLILASWAVVLMPSDANAICGRKSCVVGSGGGGGYGGDPLGGMGGMMNMMFGVIQSIQQQQQQMGLQNARALNNRGIQLLNSGDLMAAVGAFQEALQYAPGDQTIRSNLSLAKARLAELQRVETARQEAERRALQQKIGGLLDSLSADFTRETSKGTSASIQGLDIPFARPAGTSFFGTGGGGGPALSAGNAAASSGGTTATGLPKGGYRPSYLDPPVPTSAGAKPLEFVGTKDPLFEKGYQGSAAPDLRNAKGIDPSTLRPATPRGGPITTQSVRTVEATAKGASSPTPDPIVYQSTGFKAWAVRTFADPVSVGEIEQALATQRIPEIATGKIRPKEPALIPPQMPFSPNSETNEAERRAQEIANMAFYRIGDGEYDSAIRFLEVAQEQAPNDSRIEKALSYARQAKVKFQAEPPLNPPMPPHTPEKGTRELAHATSSVGYLDMSNGHYDEANDFFGEAARLAPGNHEYIHRRAQAHLGSILSKPR